MTTTALKAIDHYGGIDNYILKLDDVAVSQSNYVTKMRMMIASKLFFAGQLEPSMIRRLGFDRNPPVMLDAEGSESVGEEEDAHLT